jgi:integrase
MAFVERRAKDTWRARYRGPDGRERSKTFQRKIDAERFLTSMEASKLRGDWIDPAAGRMTLSAFSAEWMATVVHLRPTTRYRYESLLRVHIAPALGNLSLSTIRPLDVQSFVSKLRDQGLSGTTVRHAYVLLAEILNAAQRDGRIARNPATGVVPPPRRRQEQRFLNAAEVWDLAEAVEPRYRALVLTGVYGALRWGELAGLKVSRLRLLERRIDVVEGVSEVGGRLIWGPPKTGTRTVSIPAPLAEEIALHLSAFPPDGERLVFTSPGGGLLRYANFYRRVWQPAVEKTDLAPLRPHDLRHTAVALAIQAGAHPKEIQELCGHASITTTLNTYGHLFDSLQDRLAERLADTFRASRAAWARPDVAAGASAPVRSDAKYGL